MANFSDKSEGSAYHRVSESAVVATLEIYEDSSGTTFGIMQLANEEPEMLEVPPHMVQQLPMAIAMMKRQMSTGG